MLNNFDKKENPFKVPDNYFKDFNKEIMKSLPETKPSKKVSLWKKVIPLVAVAAACIGIIFYTNTPLQDEAPSSKTLNQSSYVNNNDEDFYLFIEDESTNMIYEDFFNSTTYN